MNQEQYLNRKQYVEQARNSFGDYAGKNKAGYSDRTRNSYYEQDMEAMERVPKGYFKLRLLLAVFLFLGFLFIQQTGWSYKNINASTIRKKIETSITLPESFPDLKDVVSILE